MPCARTTTWAIESASECACEGCAEALAAWRAAHWSEAAAEAEALPMPASWITHRPLPKHYSRRAWKMRRMLESALCALCGERMSVEVSPFHPRYATVDHIKPRSRGGEDHPDNWQLACLACNQEKGNAWDEPLHQPDKAAR